MSNGRDGQGGGWIAWLPAMSGGATLLGLLVWFGATRSADATRVVDFLLAAGSLLLAFLVAAATRYAIAPATRREPPRGPGFLSLGDSPRDRLAPLVMLFGGAGVVVLCLVVVVAFTAVAMMESGDSLRQKFDSVLMAIFTAVLPVFATWVGTVIAFYFSNESFRSAAQVARDSALPPPDSMTVDTAMIPFERIGRMEVDSLEEARALKMEDVARRLNQQTTRVIVFQKEGRRPLLIVRRRLMPADWLPPDMRPSAPATGPNNAGQTAGSAPAKPLNEATLADYLRLARGENQTNEQDASSFVFVALATKLDDARQAMLAANARDVFVTARGTRDEPVIGWVPDDRLAASPAARIS